jgi:hypothetical protein
MWWRKKKTTPKLADDEQLRTDCGQAVTRVFTKIRSGHYSESRLDELKAKFKRQCPHFALKTSIDEKLSWANCSSVIKKENACQGYTDGGCDTFQEKCPRNYLRTRNSVGGCTTYNCPFIKDGRKCPLRLFYADWKELLTLLKHSFHHHGACHETLALAEIKEELKKIEAAYLGDGSSFKRIEDFIRQSLEQATRIAIQFESGVRNDPNCPAFAVESAIEARTEVERLAQIAGRTAEIRGRFAAKFRECYDWLERKLAPHMKYILLRQELTALRQSTKDLDEQLETEMLRMTNGMFQHLFALSEKLQIGTIVEALPGKRKLEIADLNRLGETLEQIPWPTELETLFTGFPPKQIISH